MTLAMLKKRIIMIEAAMQWVEVLHQEGAAGLLNTHSARPHLPFLPLHSCHNIPCDCDDRDGGVDAIGDNDVRLINRYFDTTHFTIASATFLFSNTFSICHYLLFPIQINDIHSKSMGQQVYFAHIL